MMQQAIPSRDLTANEREALEIAIEASPFSQALSKQALTATVKGGLPTFLDLDVQGEPATACPDGPLTVRAFVSGPSGETTGEILVWVEAGLLSALEFAWYTDKAPEEFPPPESINVQSIL
jgi:hypothetical protein